MIVALRALHLDAQEDLRGLGRGLHGVVLEAAGHEIDEAVEVLIARLVDTGRGDQLVDHAVIRNVAPGTRGAGTVANPRGLPASGARCRRYDRSRYWSTAWSNCGRTLRRTLRPAGARRVALALVGRLVEEPFQFVDRRNAAQDVQIDPAAPFAVGRWRRGGELSPLPMRFDVLVDQRDLRRRAIACGSRGLVRRCQHSEEGQRRQVHQQRDARSVHGATHLASPGKFGESLRH